MTEPANVEALVLQLLAQRNTKDHFSQIGVEPVHYKRLLTAAYIAECNIRKCSYNDNVQQYIDQAAEMLTTPSRNFGLIMFGTPGNGKTTLLKAIQNSLVFLRQKGFVAKDVAMKVLTARDFTRMALDNKDYNDKNDEVLGIDDLGIEPTETMHYGNISTPIVEMLEHRYNKRLYTIITTNLKPEEIRAKYGDRIADRFNEMFHRIIFKNGTHRI